MLRMVVFLLLFNSSENRFYDDSVDIAPACGNEVIANGSEDFTAILAKNISCHEKSWKV